MPYLSEGSSEWMDTLTDAITLAYGSQATGQTTPGGGWAGGLIPSMQNVQDQTTEQLSMQAWAMKYGKPVFDDATAQQYYDYLQSQIAASQTTTVSQAQYASQAAAATASAAARQQGVGVIGQLDLNKMLPYVIGGGLLFIFLNRKQQSHF
jgi:hypothetical protein